MGGDGDDSASYLMFTQNNDTYDVSQVNNNKKMTAMMFDQTVNSPGLSTVKKQSQVKK